MTHVVFSLKKCPCGTTAGRNFGPHWGSPGSSYRCEMRGMCGPHTCMFPGRLILLAFELSSWIGISLNQLSILTEVMSTKPNFNCCALFLGVCSSKAVEKFVTFRTNQSRLQRGNTSRLCHYPNSCKGCRLLASLELASGVGWGSVTDGGAD